MPNLFQKAFFSLVLFCSFGFQLYSQEKNLEVEEVIKKYSDYFTLNRESVYLHLNKTAVAPTEGLWFSAYIYNTKHQIPNPATTNLNVNIYDSKGMLVEAKTFFVGNGKGAGFLKLDTTKYAPGDYLITASTNYMGNFREDLSFSQKIRILGQTDIASLPIKYDLQFLPEGGHLVEGVPNTIGVKLLDNSGKGVIFTDAKVLDSKGQVVTTFKSNGFGISKFSLEPKPNENYSIALTPKNGKEIRKPIMPAEKTGIAITANSLLPNDVVFSIKTNQSTYKSLEGKTLFIGIGQKGTMKALGFIIPKSMEAMVKIPKTALYPGINRITIFSSEMKPIAERLVFHRHGLKRKQVEASYKKRFMDSLVIGLSSLDSLGLHSLSVSVLPVGTKAYSPRNNLLSAFYIEPYIKGNLENGAYYFSRETGLRRRDYDLDLLLLTQGWSKYSWKNIFNHTPVEYFQHEQGFDLTGKVNGRNEKKENQLFVKSSGSGFFTIVELDNKGAFELENVFLREKDTIAFGLVRNGKGKVSKPGIYYRLSPQKKSGDIASPESLGLKIKKPTIANAVEKQETFPEKFLKDRVELSQIILESQMKEQENPDIQHSGGFFNTTVIDEDLASTYTYITDYIRTQGFVVKRGFTDVSILNRRKMSLRGYLAPAIFLDGMQLYDNSELLYLRTEEVKYISINKSGAGYGLDGSGGVIRITRKTNYGASGTRQTSSTSILENGFSPVKEFYAPKYVSYDDAFFTEYGSIGWFPDVRLDKNAKTEIKVWNTTQPELKLFVEGVTVDGGVISEIITIAVD